MPTMRVVRITVGLLAALCSLIVGADMPAVSANDSGTSASTDTVSIGGAEIYVGFESGELGLPRGALLNWVRKSACAVTEYYGRFPVQKVNVRIAPIGEGSGVLSRQDDRYRWNSLGAGCGLAVCDEGEPRR